MKLLYITNQICGAAGLERVLSIKTSYLIEELQYDIHILTLNQFDAPLFYKFNKNITYHDITLNGNPVKYIYKYISKIKAVVKAVNPDVISVCDDGLKAFTLPFILRKHKPIIYERHVSRSINVSNEKALSFSKKLKAKALNRLMHFGGENFDKFVVLTKDNLNEWQLKNLIVINNPLSFYPENTSNLSNKKVLAVGRQSVQKGYDRLLESWKIVSKKYPDWKLEIYGKFQAGKPFHKMAKALNIESTTTFYEPVKDIGKVYKEASIYVMSSRFEGFGMVLIEAMAYGVPCISFNCPCGPEEIITNNKNGYLVENGDVEAFANQIEKLILDKTLRQRLGDNARLKASDYFPDKIMPKWDYLFRELIKKTS